MKVILSVPDEGYSEMPCAHYICYLSFYSYKMLWFNRLRLISSSVLCYTGPFVKYFPI